MRVRGRATAAARVRSGMRAGVGLCGGAVGVEMETSRQQ